MLALALAASASLVQAQIRPPMPPGGKAFDARREEDLALLLDLTPAQKPALEAWLEASRPGPRGFHPDGPPPATAQTFGERLDDIEKGQAEAGAQARAWIAAARSFYAQLDPHQRQLFEALERLRPPMGPMHHGGPGGPPPGGLPALRDDE